MYVHVCVCVTVCVCVYACEYAQRVYPFLQRKIEKLNDLIASVSCVSGDAMQLGCVVNSTIVGGMSIMGDA